MHLVVVALVLALPADPISLKLKLDGDPGKSFVVSKTEEEKGTVRIYGADGKLLKDDKPSTTRVELYTVKVLEKGESKVAKFQRTYDKATITTQGKTVARGYEGKTVTYVLKDDNYVASGDGVSLADLRDLERQQNGAARETDQLFLPDKPVNVGDSWKISGRTLGKAMGPGATLDLDASEGSAILLKAYDKNGARFGVIEVTLKLSVKQLEILKFEKPASMTMKVTLDAAVDGRSTAGVVMSGGKVSGKGLVEQGDAKLQIEIEMTTTNREERTAER